MSSSRIAVAYCVHDDHWFLGQSIESFASAGDVFVFLSTVPWNGDPGDWQRADVQARLQGATVIMGEWPAEILHRQGALSWLAERGYTHALMPDSDEIIEPKLLDTLTTIAKSRVAQRAYVAMDTYWKSADRVIRPRERLMPLLLLEIAEVYPNDIDEFNGRLYSGGRELFLGPDHGVLHHLSYAGPDERIRRKTSTWSHQHEVSPRWWTQVWLRWDKDPLLQNLHPTHDWCYRYAEHIRRPACLADIDDTRPATVEPVLPEDWPTVSVVIPLYGGEIEIRSCLESLDPCRDLIHEIIVVDDCSPDGAAGAVRDFDHVRLLRNDANVGFGATCNRGYDLCSGDVVMFLNSDTIVPRAGLIRLIESLIASSTVGASGPFTNNAAYFQRTATTYSSTDTIDLFATDFAHRQAYDEDVSMLVGFCLAVKRAAIKELKQPPFDERFGQGMYEDNDLSYRLQRAGFRLRLSARSFVHHKGHQSLERIDQHPVALLRRNERIFFDKWREEIECGFASALPGQTREPIIFRPDRHPDRIAEQIRDLALVADISLCMIVKNEERVLGDCLHSVQGVFAQVVIVDTGSTDRTVAIATEYGAEVHIHPWEDSFSVARNHSLSYARGRWVFWMDADDTLPRSSAEAILQAAIHAAPEVVGFVVPVQFVDEGPGSGTRVDHVKLFRNVPDLSFEGRIHEQVLPSLRAAGGQIARLDAVVLHSGYDTSNEGQARKRERDWKLLRLDLEERPQHPFVLFNLGMTAHYTGDHVAAIEWLQASIEVAAPNESHIRKAYGLLGVSERELGDSESALRTFAQGLDVVGEDPELRFHAGITLASVGRFAEAREQYLAMNPDVSGYFSSVDISILTFKRSHNLGVVCNELGRYQEARDWWCKATDQNPRFVSSAVALFEAAKAVGDVVSMQKAIESVGAAEGASELWARLVTERAGLLGADAEGTMKSLYQDHPGAVGPGLLLARYYLDQGFERRAGAILANVDNWGSPEAAYLRGVCAMRVGDFEAALVYMRRALELNPQHEQTRKQIEGLERAVESLS